MTNRNENMNNEKQNISVEDIIRTIEEIMRDYFIQTEIQQITSLIESDRQASFRAGQEDVRKACTQHQYEQFGDGYRSGQIAMREEAIKIADNHNGCVDTKCLSESNCGATVANQIYALPISDSEAVKEKINSKIYYVGCSLWTKEDLMELIKLAIKCK